MRPYRKEIKKPIGGLFQPFNFFEEFSVLRHTFLNVSYNAFFIDQISYPPFVVQLSYRLVFVGNQRERNSIFFCKFFVGLNAVTAYTQNLGVQVFKAFYIFLEGLQFAFSDRCKV